MMRRLALLVVAFTVVMVLPSQLMAISFGHEWDWAAGLCAGALVTFIISVRESPPEYIERLRTGAEGEKRTAKVVRRLGESWRDFHDLDGGSAGGNWDHVIVGPAGVFVLDSKWFQGETTVEDGVVRVRRFEDPGMTYVAEGISQRMHNQARAVHAAIRARTHMRPWVTPVVVLWGSFDQQVIEANGVFYVAGAKLRDWILGRPANVFPDVAVERVVSVLK